MFSVPHLRGGYLRMAFLLLAALAIGSVGPAPTLAQPQPTAGHNTPGGDAPEGTAVMSGLDFAPDGQRLASVDKRNRIAVWDVETGALLQTLPGQDAYMYALDWSPDGSRIASASMDGTVAVWDVASGDRLLSVGDLSAASDRMAGGIVRVAFAPDGRHVTGMQILPAGALVVWRVSDGAAVMRVRRVIIAARAFAEGARIAGTVVLEKAGAGRGAI
jgi:hypothetical protein